MLQLQYLYAGHNKDLEMVPREIAKLESLVALDLSNCNIQEIPDDVGLMPKVSLRLDGERNVMLSFIIRHSVKVKQHNI